jgi:hypothetical protein
MNFREFCQREVRRLATLNGKPRAEDAGMDEQKQKALLVEYSEVNQNYRAVADHRFKLLAFIPALAGVAVFLLSRVQQGRSRIWATAY